MVLVTVRRDGFRNRVTLTFDLLTSGSIHAECAKFGVDISIRFPVRARTNRQTDATERFTQAGGYAVVGNKRNIISVIKRIKR